MASDGATLTARERDILRAVLSGFAGSIDRAAIFGSRAPGRARSASDIDLVLYGTLDDRSIARIWTLFDESGLAVTVDVVRYEELADGPFRRHIDACAREIFSRGDLLAACNDRAA